MMRAAKSSRRIPEDFVPMPGFPGYYINREGVCLGPHGKPLAICHGKSAAKAPTYRIRGKRVPVQQLLIAAFVDEAHAQRATGPIRQYGNRAQRRCHDCGQPTNNYRCPACWERIRGGAAAEENEWNTVL